MKGDREVTGPSGDDRRGRLLPTLPRQPELVVFFCVYSWRSTTEKPSYGIKLTTVVKLILVCVVQEQPPPNPFVPGVVLRNPLKAVWPGLLRPVLEAALRLS